MVFGFGRLKKVSEDIDIGPDILSEKEEKAIESLMDLAKRWPKTLWLYSASGSLCVMKKNDKGEIAMIQQPGSEGVDPAYHVATIRIENDGGDW